MSVSLCIVCDTNVSCHFFAVFVKIKDSRCAKEFVSASPILTGRIRTLDVLGSFGQKMSAIFFRTIWPQAMLQNDNTITAFTFVASSLILTQVLQKCLLGGPPLSISFLFKPLNLIDCHHRNRKVKFAKKILKSNSSETIWGIKLKLCRIVHNISLYKILFYCRW